MPPRYSVIIPAYNEERYLPRLLDSLDLARAVYGEPEAVEVLVADNGSTDRTAALASARGCRVVPVEKRVIASARNGGAAAARGDVLAFVDADARVHPNTFRAIDQTLASGNVVAGATGARLERWSMGILFTYLTLVPMIYLTGLDTGVVFCHRDDFQAVGGYDESLLVAEDVTFLLALRRHGRTNGRRLARVTTAKIIASTRKFDQFGDWHYFPLMLEGVRHLLRRDVTGFTDRYWYKPGR